jgi:hypothetical protein
MSRTHPWRLQMANRSSPLLREIHAISACNSGLTCGRNTTSADIAKLGFNENLTARPATAQYRRCHRTRQSDPPVPGNALHEPDAVQASSTSRMFSVESGSHCSLFSEVDAPRVNRDPVSARSLLPGSKGLTRRNSHFRCPVPLNYVYVRAEKHLAQSVRVRPNVRSSRLIETATLSMSRTSWE